MLCQIEADSPLDTSGLRAGDVIVQVGDELLPNREDPTLSLIELIETQHTPGEPLVLRAWSGGELVAVSLELDSIPLDRGLPASIDRFDAMAERALAYLASEQRPDGSWATDPASSEPNPATTALACSAFMAGGHTLRSGAHQDVLRLGAEFWSEALSADAAELKPWDTAFGTAFLAELAAQSGSRPHKRMLARAVELLLEQQADDGGWLEGAPTHEERDLVTNQALGALGMAARAGAEIPDQAWTDACRYLVHSANEGYVGRSRSAQFDRRGERARCAGAAAALLAMNCARTDAHLLALVGYQTKLATEVAEAPRAPALGVLHAAVLAKQRGGPAWSEFCRQFRYLLVSVLKRDGSCHWIPRPRPAQRLPFEGPTFDTACVALITSLQHDRSPTLLATHGPDDLPRRDSTGAVLQGSGAATPTDRPQLPPGAQVIQLKAGESLRDKLESLGVSEEQIEQAEKQVPVKKKAPKGGQR